METILITEKELKGTIDAAVNKAIQETKDHYARKSSHFNIGTKHTDEQNPQLVGAYIRNLMVSEKSGRSLQDVANDYAKKSGTLASKIVAKGLNESNADDGGVFVIPEVSDMFIELLTAQNVIRGLNTTKMRTASGSLEINREDVGAGAFWTTENPGAVTKSNPKYGKYTLTPKKLMAWATISNDLLNDAGFNVEQILQNQILKAAGRTEELAFLYGGGANEPKGIVAWMNASNKFNQTGTTTELIEQDLFAMEAKINQKRVATELAWLMPYRTFSALRTKMRAGSGFIGFPELRDTTPSLLGHPVVITNNIPIDGGIGHNEGSILLLNQPDFIIVDRMDQEFRINPIQNDSNFPVGIDETLIVSISKVDALLKYDTAAAILNKVTY